MPVAKKAATNKERKPQVKRTEVIKLPSNPKTRALIRAASLKVDDNLFNQVDPNACIFEKGLRTMLGSSFQDIASLSDDKIHALGENFSQEQLDAALSEPSDPSQN